MSKSLAELRQSPRVGLPERSYSLCLSAALVAEVQSLHEEKEGIALTSRAVDEDGQPTGAPGRMGSKPNPRLAEIKERLEELWAEMDEHTGELRLRAVQDGDWRRWVDAHPAREESVRDAAITWATCNADDLIDDLATYALSWNGVELQPGDWDFIRSNAAPGDLKQLAQIVVGMHEAVADLPKLRSDSFANRRNGNG